MGFYKLLKKYMFDIIEKHMSEFSDLYSQRMTEYFKIFHEGNPGIALSFAFLKNLHGKIQLDFEGQTILEMRFSKTMTSGLKNMRVMAGHAS